MREAGNPVERVNAGFGTRQRVGADIGSVKQGALGQVLFIEEDLQRPQFLARAAPRHPDLDGRIGPQYRHHLLAQRQKIGRIAEHVAHLHRQVLKQPCEIGAASHDPVLQLRKRGEAELVERLGQPAAQRRHRVMAKIVLILQIDRLQQQRQFDVEIADARGPRFGRSGVHLHDRSLYP